MIFVNSEFEYVMAVFCESDDSDEPSAIVTTKQIDEVEWKNFTCPACGQNRNSGDMQGHYYQAVFNRARYRRLQEAS